MELITALTNLNWTQAFMTLLGFIVLIGAFTGGGAVSSDDEDDDEYQNASWNPGSVNYNG
jgi:hypothetical protein